MGNIQYLFKGCPTCKKCPTCPAQQTCDSLNCSDNCPTYDAPLNLHDTYKQVWPDSQEEAIGNGWGSARTPEGAYYKSCGPGNYYGAKGNIRFCMNPENRCPSYDAPLNANITYRQVWPDREDNELVPMGSGWGIARNTEGEFHWSCGPGKYYGVKDNNRFCINAPEQRLR